MLGTCLAASRVCSRVWRPTSHALFGCPERCPWTGAATQGQASRLFAADLNPPPMLQSGARALRPGGSAEHPPAHQAHTALSDRGFIMGSGHVHRHRADQHQTLHTPGCSQSLGHRVLLPTITQTHPHQKPGHEARAPGCWTGTPPAAPLTPPCRRGGLRPARITRGGCGEVCVGARARAWGVMFDGQVILVTLVLSRMQACLQCSMYAACGTGTTCTTGIMCLSGAMTGMPSF